MPAPKIFKSTDAANLVFVMTPESGIVLTDISQNVQSVVSEVRGPGNDVEAVAISGITNEISLNGYTNGTSSATVGALLSLTNSTDVGGISGGTIIVKTVSFTHTQGEFQKVSISATKYGTSMTLSS